MKHTATHQLANSLGSFVLACLLTILVIAAIDHPAGQAEPLSSTSSSIPTIANVTTSTITLTTTGFQPRVLTVSVGTEVTWYNATSKTHLLRSGEPYVIYLPLVLRQALSLFATESEGVEITLKKLLMTSASFSGTLAPGGVLTYTFSAQGSYPYFLGTAPNLQGRVVVTSDLPPDPAEIAPPLDQTVATTLISATEFLYSGSDPIQTGVAPGTIEMTRVAVLRGRVLVQDGSPLPGVTVTVLNHPEFGQTRSRLDGRYDLAVNGGGLLTMRYEKADLLSSQRQIDAPWQDYAQLPDVMLIQLDTHVTSINLTGAITMQVAQGSVISDSAGRRQATLLFPPQTQAAMTFPADHRPTRVTLSSMNVRATEYTMGEHGPQAMPDELPANTGYTYAAEFSADEAMATHAVDVEFSQPVISYMENFLHAGVGWSVPAGYYDRAQGTWVASDNGRVVKIITTTNGLADLDTDGDGAIDNGVVVTPTMVLTITVDERQRLADLYQPGQSLWRVPIRHFSAWDLNWPFGPPPDATYPDQSTPAFDSTAPHEEECQMSIIRCQAQILGEALDVIGTPFQLYYQSHRTPGRKAAYTLDIPLSSATVPTSLIGIDLEISVAGREFTHVITRDHECLHQEPLLSQGSTASFALLAPADQTDLTGQHYIFTWDGKDVYGRTSQGRQPVTVRIGYVYCGVYQKSDRFGYNGNGLITGSRTRDEVTLWQVWRGSIGAWDARPLGLGGWTLDVHHTYDPVSRELELGDGRRRTVDALGPIITSIASASNMAGMTMAPDGSLYVPSGNRIIRVYPNGTITTVAGTGDMGYSGDGGPATQAQLNNPKDVALAPDGSLYIADFLNYRVRRVSPSGIITTVVGNGGNGYSPDGIPAVQAQLYEPQWIAVGPDNSLYIVHGREWLSGPLYVRRVGSDGILNTAAGGSYPCLDGVRATQSDIGQIFGFDVGSDGSLYLSTLCNGPRVRRVTPDGIVQTLAGNGGSSMTQLAGPAKEVSLYGPGAIGVAPDGSFYFQDGDSIRRVGPDGYLTTIAGKPDWSSGDEGDGDLATRAAFWFVKGVLPAPDGNLYVSDAGNNRIRRITPRLPGLSHSDMVIPSDDGSQVYVFDHFGRHLRTLNALTGAAIDQFSYDARGQLIRIQDGDGNITTIERDASGKPIAIVSPYGQRTTVELDANGYLARVTNPAGESNLLNYTDDGLLLTLIDPRGALHHFSYDPTGRLIRDEDPVGGWQMLARTAFTSSYQVTRTSALSRTTLYQVETLGTGDRWQVNTLPDGTFSQMWFGVNGTRVMTQPDGTVNTMTDRPEPRWGMQSPLLANVAISTPNGLIANLALNRKVNLTNPDDPLSLTSLTDQIVVNGRTFRTDYTAASLTFTDTTPLGRQITTTTDAQGRVVWEQIAGLLPDHYNYDTHGRLITATLGTGPDTRMFTVSYDNHGNVASVIDPIGRVMSLQYDLAGRVTTQTLPGNRTILYAYDANGNRTSITPPGRPAHTFTFTPVDLQSTYLPPTVGAGGNQTVYTYNVDRQLTHVARPDGQNIDLGYDNAGRLTTLTTPRGVLGYGYSPTTGQLFTLTAPGGITLSYRYDGELLTGSTWAGPISGTVVYSYDTDFRLASQTVNGLSVIFQYDADGLLTHAGDLTLNRDARHGLLVSTTLGSIADTRNYNGFGEVIDYSAAYSATPLLAIQYAYDKLGRIVGKHETIGGGSSIYTYTYDVAGRLADVQQNGATSAAYEYDSNGNRLSYTGTGGTLAGVYDVQDRLLQYGTTVYTYTANGDLLHKTNGGQITSYNYDALGNLVSVTLPDGTLLEYLIDGQNRRIGKKVNGTLVQGFLYQDQLAPIAELDGAGNLVSQFIYASHDNVPDTLIKGGNTYRIIADHLGSPRLVINTATGAIVQRLDYDAFGNVIQNTNPGFQPFGFAGGLYDAQTKLTRFGARDYDAETDRWTTKDPIGFVGGDTNLYQYVFNDPVNLIDSTGHGFWHDLKCWWRMREYKKALNQCEQELKQMQKQECVPGEGDIDFLYKYNAKSYTEAFQKCTAARNAGLRSVLGTCK